MSGIPRGRERNSCENEATTSRALAYSRQLFKCMPDFIPAVLCLLIVAILSTIIQTESNMEMLNEVYSKLSSFSNATDEKLNAIEGLILKMGIDCGVDDLEMRNIKDNRIQLEEMIKQRIDDYDCVNNGMINWAAISLGGEVIKTKGFEPTIDTSTFLGIPCSKLSSDPTSLITKKTVSNNCWTFKGEGKVLLKLASPIYVTHFTVEHFQRDMIPNKGLLSAPKLIVVKGYRHKNDASPHTFGAFEYQLADNPQQTFAVTTPSNSQFEIVEFQFRTNHGNKEFTCVYKIQVHGRLTMDPVPLNKIQL